MDATGAFVKEQITDVLLLVSGIGLGLIAGLALFGWALWRWFGADAVGMLAEAWRHRLSAALKVAPPPLPPLAQSQAHAAAQALWNQPGQGEGLGQQFRDEGLS